LCSIAVLDEKYLLIRFCLTRLAIICKHIIYVFASMRTSRIGPAIVSILSFFPVSALAQATPQASQSYEDVRAKAIPQLSQVIQCVSRAFDDSALDACVPPSLANKGMDFSKRKLILNYVYTSTKDCYLSSANLESFNACRLRKQEMLKQKIADQKPAKASMPPGALAAGTTLNPAVDRVAKAICIYTIEQYRKTSAQPRPSWKSADRVFEDMQSGNVFLFSVTNDPAKNGGLVSSEFRKPWLAANGGNSALASKNLKEYYKWRDASHISDFSKAAWFSQERAGDLFRAVRKACPAPG
jgi:hypothetical protein